MRTLTPAGWLLAIGLAGLAGCSTVLPPAPPTPVEKKPDPQAEEMARKREASRYQQEIVMAEVTRTHPVLSATLDRDLTKLREVIRKRGKVNEVRRDMRLGPPLREACRLRWKEGIDELMSHGAQCLGDSACESCVRGMAPRPSVVPSGSTLPGTPPKPAYPGSVPRQSIPGTVPRQTYPSSVPRQSVPGTAPRQAPPGGIRPAP